MHCCNRDHKLFRHPVSRYSASPPRFIFAWVAMSQLSYYIWNMDIRGDNYKDNQVWTGRTLILTTKTGTSYMHWLAILIQSTLKPYKLECNHYNIISPALLGQPQRTKNCCLVIAIIASFSTINGPLSLAQEAVKTEPIIKWGFLRTN